VGPSRVRAALAAMASAAVLASCEPGPVTGSPLDITTTITQAATTTAPVPHGSPSQVDRVIDGDTIDVWIGGRPERVRLIGINAAESGECFSDEASAALADLVGGEQVLLVPDRSERDQYGRLLRYVYLDGLFVNEAMVEGGFALARRYEPDTARADDLERAQDGARSARRGLWAPNACGPQLLPEATAVLSDLECDAPGNDAENLNGEWAEIRNAGPSSIDLTGWVLKDESASNRYRFPDRFALSPGAAARIHSGSGVDTAVDLYWGNTESAVWNNDGDTAFLLDPNGNIVSIRPCG
jgi:micrococcal nuclease